MLDCYYLSNLFGELPSWMGILLRVLLKERKRLDQEASVGVS